jgi:hypothetical protein
VCIFKFPEASIPTYPAVEVAWRDAAPAQSVAEVKVRVVGVVFEIIVLLISTDPGWTVIVVVESLETTNPVLY